MRSSSSRSDAVAGGEPLLRLRPEGGGGPGRCRQRDVGCQVARGAGGGALRSCMPRRMAGRVSVATNLLAACAVSAWAPHTCAPSPGSWGAAGAPRHVAAEHAPRVTPVQKCSPHLFFQLPYRSPVALDRGLSRRCGPSKMPCDRSSGRMRSRQAYLQDVQGLQNEAFRVSQQFAVGSGEDLAGRGLGGRRTPLPLSCKVKVCTSHVHRPRRVSPHLLGVQLAQRPPPRWRRSPIRSFSPNRAEAPQQQR
jgi:hypothetical protein